ncbi:unnamed protein product [Dibothriocephalus latus]|uniref:Uncharacterized protein n=1 Tax=Dibothriocephalus latus TaxID=60516 RepID=A0A3P7PYP6_DIBLA|nr:unnamed protein product [Dibothriocephalus latus]
MDDRTSELAEAVADAKKVPDKQEEESEEEDEEVERPVSSKEMRAALAAMNVSGRFLRLMGELECDVSFEGTQSRGTCCLTNRPKLDLLGLEWIEKLGLPDLPLNRFCNGVQSTRPSPAKSNQLTTDLMSTPQLLPRCIRRRRRGNQDRIRQQRPSPVKRLVGQLTTARAKGMVPQQSPHPLLPRLQPTP